MYKKFSVEEHALRNAFPSVLMSFEIFRIEGVCTILYLRIVYVAVFASKILWLSFTQQYICQGVSMSALRSFLLIDGGLRPKIAFVDS